MAIATIKNKWLRRAIVVPSLIVLTPVILVLHILHALVAEAWPCFMDDMRYIREVW